MKKSKAATAETRKRIVKTAAREFRGKGISATGLAEIMTAAGLTHGGFYRHFDSKDRLVAEACGEGMHALLERTEAAAAQGKSKGGFKEILESYLSIDHRDNRAAGCPLASLGSELVRSDSKTRAVASEGLLGLVEILTKQIRLARPEATKADAIFALSAMVGAVTLSRIVSDPELSASVLRDTKRRLVATV